MKGSSSGEVGSASSESQSVGLKPSDSESVTSELEELEGSSSEGNYASEMSASAGKSLSGGSSGSESSDVDGSESLAVGKGGSLSSEGKKVSSPLDDGESAVMKSELVGSDPLVVGDKPETSDVEVTSSGGLLLSEDPDADNPLHAESVSSSGTSSCEKLSVSNASPVTEDAKSDSPEVGESSVSLADSGKSSKSDNSKSVSLLEGGNTTGVVQFPLLGKSRSVSGSSLSDDELSSSEGGKTVSASLGSVSSEPLGSENSSSSEGRSSSGLSGSVKSDSLKVGLSESESLGDPLESSLVDGGSVGSDASESLDSPVSLSESELLEPGESLGPASGSNKPESLSVGDSPVSDSESVGSELGGVSTASGVECATVASESRLEFPPPGGPASSSSRSDLPDDSNSPLKEDSVGSLVTSGYVGATALHVLGRTDEVPELSPLGSESSEVSLASEALDPLLHADESDSPLSLEDFESQELGALSLLGSEDLAVSPDLEVSDLESPDLEGSVVDVLPADVHGSVFVEPGSEGVAERPELFDGLGLLASSPNSVSVGGVTPVFESEVLVESLSGENVSASYAPTGVGVAVPEAPASEVDPSVLDALGSGPAGAVSSEGSRLPGGALSLLVGRLVLEGDSGPLDDAGVTSLDGDGHVLSLGDVDGLVDL